MYIKRATTPKTILFYYNRDTLFNDVSLMSNYMCKNLSTKDGNSLTDDYSISDDDEKLVEVSIRAALPDIYEAMTKITYSVSSAFDDSVEEAGSTSGTTIGSESSVSIPAGNYVEFTLLDNQSYNQNVIPMVDASLYNCIQYGTLKEVYSTIAQPEFLKLCEEGFVSELFKLKQRLFQLKKKSVSSQLT